MCREKVSSSGRPPPGQHQGDEGGVVVEQPAGGEREGVVAFRRARLHLDVGVLARHRVDALLHEDRLEVADNHDAIGLGQLLRSHSGAQYFRAVVALLVGEQKRRPLLDGDPRRQARHGAEILGGVRRVGDDEVGDRPTLEKLLDAGGGDSGFVGERYHRGVAVAAVQDIKRYTQRAGEGGGLEEQSARLGPADDDLIGLREQDMPGDCRPRLD